MYSLLEYCYSDEIWEQWDSVEGMTIYIFLPLFTRQYMFTLVLWFTASEGGKGKKKYRKKLSIDMVTAMQFFHEGSKFQLLSIHQ